MNLTFAHACKPVVLDSAGRHAQKSGMLNLGHTKEHSMRFRLWESGSPLVL